MKKTFILLILGILFLPLISPFGVLIDPTMGNIINSTSWNKSGTYVYLANVADNVGIGTDSPDFKLQVDGDIVSETTGTDSIGSLAIRWLKGWFSGLDILGNVNITGNLFVNEGKITGESEKSWAFKSPSGSTGIFYYGGYYNFDSSANDFNPSINWGTANGAYASHFSVICASGATDTEITITGTSISDEGIRNATDSHVLVLSNGSVNAYTESSKKWLGQITIEKTAGTDKLCNYGFSKYWDNNNGNFTVIGIEATWLGGANDGGANIELLHHNPYGWTYNVGAEPTHPTAITDMNTDHNTEINILNGQNGAWKRSNLNQFVWGDNGEGTIIKITTSANKAFDLGNIILRIRGA